MNPNTSGSLQSSNGGDDGVNHHRLHILQPPSNFSNPSTFSQSLNPNNSIYDMGVQKYPNPVDDKLGVITKNPKKRTRASRRAPTTVLTTDTTNFRQMVQEFTGIPASPFATSSSASSAGFSRRLDLYGSGVVKPSAHKPSYLNNDNNNINNNNNNNSNYISNSNNNINVTPPTSGFQLNPLESYGITKQPLNLSNLQNLQNLQNQMFPFQSLSQSAQVNGTDEFVGSSSKTWRGQDENMVNCQNVVVSNDGDRLPGEDNSWICSSD